MKKIKTAGLTLHLGHTKIIGRENGLPVHSLFIPPEYSDPMNYAHALMYNRLRTGHTTPPVICNLAITKDCTCRCKHCYAAGLQGEDLTFEQWQYIISQCQNAGVFSILFTGGEPLLRNDIHKLISTVDRTRSVPILFTNGEVLKENAAELKRNGLNRVLISIDFANEKLHNEHRGRAGLFTRALDGLEECQRLGMLTAFSTFSSPGRLYDGTIENILNLGQECGVNEIAVFDEMPAGNYSDKKDISPLDSPYYEALLEFIDDKQKTIGPGIWAYSRIRTYGSCECTGGKGYLKIAHNGEVHPCDTCRISVGNIMETPISVLLHRLRHEVEQRLADDPRCLMLQLKN